EAGMEAGDKAAGGDRQRYERDDAFRGTAPASSHPNPPPLAGEGVRRARTEYDSLPRERGRAGVGARPNQSEGDPEGDGIDRQREQQMRDEPVLADIDALGEAAFDHPPAERALHRAEPEDSGQGPGETPRDPAAREEIEEREKVSEADQPAPEA